MKVHELKIKHMYCIDIVRGLKTFEIRKNDRDFKVDDILHLKEIHDCSGDYTGFEMFVKVVYIHESLGLQEGYVCMAIKKVTIDLR
jgi:hypothetical protein